MGWDGTVGIGTRYGLDGLGIELIPGGANFLHVFRLARSFPGVKWLVVPRLKKEWSYNSTPHLHLHGRLQGELYFFVPFKYTVDYNS
jgi:hypothetical protein